MKKEFELYLLSDDCGWCDGKEWQMGTYEINNLWQWIETKIDEACKKQREICASVYNTEPFDYLSVDKYYRIKNAPSPKEK